MIDLPSLRELTLARIRVMLREPEVIFWVFAFPALLAVGLGIAFTDPPREVFRVVVERGTAAEAYVEELDARPELAVTVLDPAEVEDALRRGEVSLALTGPTGIVLRFDPTRSEGQTARLLTDRALQEAAGGSRPLDLRLDEIRQRGRRYIDWLIPGLIGFNLMSTGLWAIGFYITQSRQDLQLKRLVATPMRRSHFLISQGLARFAFLALEVPLLVIVAWLAFGVEVVGSPLALAAVVLVGGACFAAMGLLAASRTRTTEGVSGVINMIVMPMVVLSGVFFSPARFPDAAQPFIRVLPLTALNDALRGVYNDGVSLLALGPELAIVAVWTVAAFFLALRYFRWH